MCKCEDLIYLTVSWDMYPFLIDCNVLLALCGSLWIVNDFAPPSLFMYKSFFRIFT